jgi:transposase
MTRAEMEIRRLDAVPALGSSLSLAMLAKRFHVSRTTIKRWRHAVEHGEPLTLRRATGRPVLTNPEQIKALYRAGPRASGFEADKWTQNRFCAAIETATGIKYDPDHVGRIMHRLGLRHKRPRKQL